jgi:tetratricopeptide (TPR) repeat protein
MSSLIRIFALFITAVSLLMLPQSAISAVEFGITKTLQSNNHDLDAKFGSLQLVYEKDHSRAAKLRDEFMVFSTPAPELNARLSEWVAAMPQSYAAHLARGIYLYKQGVRVLDYTERQNAFPSDIKKMDTLYKLARQELLISLQLTPQPLLSYEFLIRVGSNSKHDEVNLHWLSEANKFDTINLAVQRAYLQSIGPQSGGSLEAMQKFVKAPISPAMPIVTRNALQSQIWYAEALLAIKEANQYNSKEDYDTAILLLSKAIKAYSDPEALVQRGKIYQLLGEISLALADYTNAIVLNPYDIDAYTQRSRLLLDRGDHLSAYKDYALLTELESQEPSGWNARGWIMYGQGKTTAAAQYYARAAALGDSWAQNELGALYLCGKGVPKDIGKARQLWVLAANQGNEVAAKNLREYGNSLSDQMGILFKTITNLFRIK